MKNIFNIILAIGFAIGGPAIASAQQSYQFTTSPATNITKTSATISGFSSGSVLQTWVEINVGGGNIQRLGQISGAGQVTGQATNLQCGTTYFFQAAGNVSGGMTNGAPLSFQTLSCDNGGGTGTYQFTTSPATNITKTSATISGFSSGSVLQTWVEINVGGGNIQRLGQISGAGQVSGSVTGLQCNTTYFFQAAGNVAAGLTNGSPLSLHTLACDNGGGTGTVQIISFTANPVQVPTGTNTTLSWSSTGATYCMIEGQTLAVSGSRSFGPIYGNHSYTLSCFNAQGASDSRSLTVTTSQVNNNPVRIDYLNASPILVTNGGYTTLTWGTTNASSCTLTDNGTVTVNGSRSVGPIYSTRSYTLSCTGTDGSTDSRAVTVSADQGSSNNPQITSFTATPSQTSNGGYSTLYWTSINASYCTVDSSTVSTSGNRSVGPIYGTRTFTLICYGTNGGTDSRTVSVYSDNNNGGTYPTISYFSASPITVTYGGYTTLSWSSNADYCTASGDWSGSKSISGSESVGPIYSTKTYILTCYRSGNQVSQTVTVYTQNNGGNTSVDGAITNFATRVGQSSAQLNGIALTSGGRSVDGWFEWGSTVNLGNVTTVRTLGSLATNDFSDIVSGLSSNRTYYYRAVARTNNGTFRGDILHFTTGSVTPIYINPNPTPTPTGTTTLTYGRPVFMDVQVEKLATNVTAGNEAEFRISYRSLSDKFLQNVLVKVALPEEFQYVSATRGTYAQDSRTLTLPLGDLPPRLSDSFIVRVRVLDNAQIGKTVAVTAYGNYTVPAENNLQAYEDEVVSYVLVTIQDARNLNAAAIGTLGLFPGSILGWLLLIAILLLIIFLLRKLYLSFTEYQQAK